MTASQKMRGQHRTLAVLGLLVAAWQLSACGSSNSQATPHVTLPATQVAVSDNEFTQKDITVHVGQSVTWTYGGRNKHDVKAASSELKDFGVTWQDFSAQGKTYTYTFLRKGTFVYYCSIHGTKNGRAMAGTVTVIK